MYLIYKFDGRGRVLQVLECQSMAMSKLFALQNVTAKGHIDILSDETGEVLFTVQGTGRDCFPKVIDWTKQAVLT